MQLTTDVIEQSSRNTPPWGCDNRCISQSIENLVIRAVQTGIAYHYRAPIAADKPRRVSERAERLQRSCIPMGRI